MVSKKHRFHGLNSLRLVYSKGEVVRGQQITTKYILNNRRNTYRVAIVVNKRISKSAVVRNRIRRRIFEIIRHQETNITQPFDIVITVYSNQIINMPTKNLELLVVQQLIKAQIIKNKL